MGVESRKKILGWVTRGDESDGGVGVGVTLEVRLHRLVMGENWRRESGQNARVGYARRRIRI